MVTESPTAEYEAFVSELDACLDEMRPYVHSHGGELNLINWLPDEAPPKRTDGSCWRRRDHDAPAGLAGNDRVGAGQDAGAVHARRPADGRSRCLERRDEPRPPRHLRGAARAPGTPRDGAGQRWRRYRPLGP